MRPSGAMTLISSSSRCAAMRSMRSWGCGDGSPNSATMESVACMSMESIAAIKVAS